MEAIFHEQVSIINPTGLSTSPSINLYFLSKIYNKVRISIGSYKICGITLLKLVSITRKLIYRTTQEMLYHQIEYVFLEICGAEKYLPPPWGIYSPPHKGKIRSREVKFSGGGEGVLQPPSPSIRHWICNASFHCSSKRDRCAPSTASTPFSRYRGCCCCCCCSCCCCFVYHIGRVDEEYLSNGCYWCLNN